MKRKWSFCFIMAIVAMAILVTCSKEPEIIVDEPEIEETLDITTNSVTFHCTYSYYTDLSKIKLYIASDNGMHESLKEYEVTLTDSTFTVMAADLQPELTYYYQFEFFTPVNSCRSDVRSFTTVNLSKPTVTTNDVGTITATTAHGGGNVIADGNEPVTARGLCWGTTPDPTIDDEQDYHSTNGSGLGEFDFTMENLSPNTTYYVRAYATNSIGTSYGQTIEFVTLDGSAAIITTGPNNVTDVSAVCGGIINSDGGLEIVERGVCWSTDTIASNAEYIKPDTLSGIGSYTCELTGLTPSTTYHVWAYAANVHGKSYGNKLSFTTSQSYTITISANPTNGGNVSGGGTFNYGSSCTVHATANSGYTFVNWTENGEQVSQDQNYTFTIEGNRSLTANFTSSTFVISVSVEPEGSGTVSGASGYDAGQQCSLTATPNTGYEFEKWTENGTQVSTQNPYRFTVNGNRTLKAHFKKKDYTISVSASPSNGGTVSGGGTYQQGQSCTVQATANSGYTFKIWTENDMEVSKFADYTFTVTGNRNLKAIFETTPNYTINVSADPTNGGTVSGGGTYQQGQSCTVQATANNGYTFVGWSENGGIVGNGNPYTFTVDRNRTLKAVFTASSFVISASVEPEGSGTVSGAGGYNAGEQCTLTATPNTGYKFEKWTENGTTETQNPYTFTVNGNHNLVAHFSQINYTITVSADPSNGGNVSGGGSNFHYGDECTVLATPNSGYNFVNWTENGSQVSTNANYTFTVNGNRNLVAHFEAITYTIATSSSPASGGTTSGGGTYQQGEQCTVHATANTGYEFRRWTENGSQVSTNANYTFPANGNRNLVAVFELNTYTVTTSSSPTNGGTTTGGGTFNQGQSCTVHATANSGYTFVNWTENGTQVSTSANYTFTVNGNRNLVAHFSQSAQNYTITVSADPSNGGTVSGGGTYQQGTSCTVHATANSGYTFVNWTENGTQVSTSANYTFTVNGNHNLVAHFSQNPQSYTVTTSSNPTNGGTTTGGGTFNQGAQCTVTATANNGYTFANWTDNGTTVTQNPYTFTVNGNHNLVAHFSQNYTITVSADPSNGGTVSGGGTYQQGTSCTVHATANSGYTFVNWTENGTQVSTSANYTFVVNGNRNLVAHFSQNYTITVSADPSNGGTVSGGGTYQQGTSCTVHATANSGYTFVNWTENGTQVSTSANYTFVVNGNHNLVAHFSQNPQSYTITTSSNPSAGGSTSGGGNFNQGDQCTVHATANSGYTFVNWTENGTQVSTSADYTFTVNGNHNLVANFNYAPLPPAPTGAIHGLFTVGAGKQVWFSQGNLQYKPSSSQWQFAEQQYTLLHNSDCDLTNEYQAGYNGWIDLFGWATSGYNGKMPYMTSTTATDYGDGGNPVAGTHYDWGVHNAISNGGNQTGIWRTLTKEEWRYVLESRPDYNLKRSLGKVDGVRGLILLPDNWELPAGITFNPEQNSYISNSYTASQWALMEQNGAVFLPACGKREGTNVTVGSDGNYWSITHIANNRANSLGFANGTLEQITSTIGRHYGYSVRLVQDYNR